MFDIGFPELIVVAVLALVVLGPERLPAAMRSVLKSIRAIKQTANGFKNEVERQLQVHELHENLKKAEAKGLEDLSPELQESIDELKQAAESVQYPYKSKDE